MGIDSENLKLMKNFYNFFPYPNRFFFNSPHKNSNFLAHKNFLFLLKDNRSVEAKQLALTLWEYTKQKTLYCDTIKYLYKNDNWNFCFSQINILLAGCGTDEPLLFSILHKHDNIVAVDLSDKSIKKAKQKILFNFYKIHIKQISFFISDIVSFLHNHRQKFDYIQCYGVLHHNLNIANIFSQMVMSLNNDGFLRIMIYSKKGRELERALQKKIDIKIILFFIYIY